MVGWDSGSLEVVFLWFLGFCLIEPRRTWDLFFFDCRESSVFFCECYLVWSIVRYSMIFYYENVCIHSWRMLKVQTHFVWFCSKKHGWHLKQAAMIRSDRFVEIVSVMSSEMHWDSLAQCILLVPLRVTNSLYLLFAFEKCWKLFKCLHTTFRLIYIDQCPMQTFCELWSVCSIKGYFVLCFSEPGRHKEVSWKPSGWYLHPAEWHRANVAQRLCRCLALKGSWKTTKKHSKD